MNIRYAIVLVAAFALLAGLVLYLNSTDKPADLNAGEYALISVADADVREVRLTDGSKETVLQAGDGGTWNVAAPAPGPADLGQVTATLNILTQLSASTRVGQGLGDLAPFGLTRPTLVAQVLTTQGQAIKLSLGAESPMGDGRYVVVEGDPAVYIVPAYVYENLKRAVTDPPVQKATPTPGATAVGIPPPAFAPTPTPAGPPTPTATAFALPKPK